MDDQFVSKVYRTIVYTWALAMVWAVAFEQLWMALNITFGVIIGAAILAANDLVIRRILVPGAQSPRRALSKVIFLKYFAAIIALFFLTRWHRFNPYAFIGGIILTHLAILIKLAGIKLMERRKQGEPTDK